MKYLLTTALLIMSALAALAQDFPGEVGRDPDANLATYGILVFGPNDQVALPAQILSVRKHGDGVDVTFVGEENRKYVLWASDDGRTWHGVAVAGEIGPGLYMAHDESAQGARKRFYSIVEVEDERPFDPQQFHQGLLGMVRMQEELTSEQRAAFNGAAEQLAQAKEALVQDCNEVSRAKKCLADCLPEVMRLRLAAQQAEAQAKMAESRADRLEAPLLALDDVIHSLNEQKRKAKADLQTAIDDFLHLTASIDREQNKLDTGLYSERERKEIEHNIESFKAGAAAKLRDKARFEAEIMRLMDELAAAWEKARALLPPFEAAEKEAGEKRAAADAAEQVYQDAKMQCDGKKQALQDAEARKRQAEGQLAQADHEFGRARAAAAQQVDDNRKAREAAAAAAKTEAERQAAARAEAQMKAAQEQARRDLEQSLQAWKCFFDYIRETSGEQEAERIADTIGGAWWDTIKVLSVLKGAFKGLARGQSVQAAISGIAMSGLQVGYGVLVSYARQKIINALKNILGGTTARWIKELENNMQPGESRVVKFSNSVHVLVKTVDGQVYVFSWNKNYFTSGGTYREDVFID